jgi:hypothetical protein
MGKIKDIFRNRSRKMHEQYKRAVKKMTPYWILYTNNKETENSKLNNMDDQRA